MARLELSRRDCNVPLAATATTKLRRGLEGPKDSVTVTPYGHIDIELECYRPLFLIASITFLPHINDQAIFSWNPLSVLPSPKKERRLL